MSEAEDPWSSQLEQELIYWVEGTLEYDLAVILKENLLLSDGEPAAADTALLIDDYCESEYLTSDPLMKFEDDRGMGSFLSGFYDVMFSFARLISYKDHGQEKLVRFLLELRRLPAKPYKIWNVCKSLL